MADHLFGIATGVIGWIPDVAWNTPVDEIEQAYTFHIHGGPPQPKPPKQNLGMQMKGFAAWHNAKVKQGDGSGIGKARRG